MSEPQETWTHRDLPVLRVLVQRFDQRGPHKVRAADITGDLEMDQPSVEQAMRALVLGEYVTRPPAGASTRSGEGFTLGNATERAYREVGLWPSAESVLDRMITALQAIAEHTDDEDTRTRARKILDGMTGAGRHIGLAAATAVVTGQLPS